MPWVNFVSEAGDLLARVEAAPGDNLLDIARLNDVPLHWRCGQGTCGTCRVHLRHAAQPAALVLGGKARNVMLRAGLLEPDAPALQIDDEHLWRLACHLCLQDDDLTVIVPPPSS